MAKLVIVESPAKAKTISRILGPGYIVEASFGHVRDLPETSDDIPAEFKKLKWAKLGVNIEQDFEPLYVVPSSKKRRVDDLKKAAKGVDEILLATDEDREGESISWHILQILKPAKKVGVKRIVFHEITPEAINEAVRSPRDVNESVVRAQEARRILDRLYGFTLSPLLWKKVAPKLSAGRVQSVAVRLCVERERERRAFVSAEYWDLSAQLFAPSSEFKATLTLVQGKRVASGRHFDSVTGKMTGDAVLIDRDQALDLRTAAENAKAWAVSSAEKKPGQETPPPPFMTSTLQQEANRKLRWPSKRTMQIAQTLYEGVDLRGDRVGLITYMRTDSLNLAERALQEAREVIRDLYGAEFLPNSPVRYRTKSKGAQEAHEAIRPTDLSRRPQDVRSALSDEQYALYDLIWKRTLASQMLPAKVLRNTVEIEATTERGTLTFGASGKEIGFPGFLRAYVEGSDDPESELGDRETVLPAMKVGQPIECCGVGADEHHTRPPARYTEASLIKTLEEAGVGRPSTYSSIISTIQDRGYVNKKGNELIPTFTAFAVTELLEDYFTNLVDLRFTAHMEEELDEVADGDRHWVEPLREFFLGEDGLQQRVDRQAAEIPFPAMELGKDESGEPVIVRVGRYGTFVQRGEGGPGNRATVPDTVAPADLDLASAIKLLSGPAAVGTDPVSGRPVFLRKGRFGDYFEVEQTPEEAEAGEKPRRASVPKGMSASEVTEEQMGKLLQFPRDLGLHPDSGQPIMVTIGQYGPYVKSGTEIRNIETWEQAAEITRDEAIAVLATAKPVRGRGAAAAAAEAIKEFAAMEGVAGPMRVLAGRYGPYVTDGKTNATLPKDMAPEDVTAEQARDLIVARAGQPKKKGFKKRSFARK
ncbi:MAG: type I DNA topoisomerase [Chthonomonas sp.]|nr:type I DNA topoisomerase [Chthonomonas sp.]